MTKQEVKMSTELTDARFVPEVVQIACGFESEIKICYKDKTINAKSLMGMMIFDVAKEETFTVQADGVDEKEAIARIASCFEKA